MRVQFLSSDNKILYCDDNILKITKGKKEKQWQVSEVGKAWVENDTIYFCDNTGTILEHVIFTPQDQKKIEKITAHINSQNKNVIVDETGKRYIESNNKKRGGKALFNFIIIAAVLLTIFVVMPGGDKDKNKIEKLSKQVYGDVNIIHGQGFIRIEKSVPEEKDIYVYFVNSIESLKKSELPDQYPDLKIVVKVETKDGELSSYSGSANKLSKLDTSKTSSVETFLLELNK